MDEDPQLLTAGDTASVVAELVEKHIKPQVVDVADPHGGKAPVLVLPASLRAASIKSFVDEYLDAPRRRAGKAVFNDLASFIAHAKRFADADSALFANPTPSSPSLTSVLDYHRAGAASAPRFGEHRGLYTFPLSDEWTAWTSHHGKAMSQAEFAEWVENRITDVADPAGAGGAAAELAATLGCTFASPSKLLELSRGLTVRVGARVQNAVNLATGEAAMQFVSQHQDEAGGQLKVPAAFLIAAPVFRNGAPYQIAVRLRYRVRDGGVTWFYELYRADRAFADAFNEACGLATKETGLPLFVGSPE